MTTTHLPAPPALSCHIEDDDPIGHHLICADRDTCAFDTTAELDPATALPEFWATADRAELLWLAEHHRRNPALTSAQVDTALHRYRCARALDARNDRERRQRIAVRQAAAETCPVCELPGTIVTKRQAPLPASDDYDDDRHRAPVRAQDGTVLGTTRVRPSDHRRASIDRLPSFAPYPEYRLTYTGLDGGRRTVTACRDCQAVIDHELKQAQAHTVLPSGTTRGATVRTMLGVQL